MLSSRSSPRHSIRPRGSHVSQVEAEDAGSDGGAVYQGTAWKLTSNAAITTTVELPGAGDYTLSVRAWGDQAGPEPARMLLSVDGVEVELFDVTATEAAPAVYEHTAAFDAGARVVSVAFTNDYYMPDLGEDRNLAVDWIRVEGPLGVPGTHPARERILVCSPDDSNRMECARDIVRDFGKRAWRRPMTADEIESLGQVADASLAAGDDFDTAIGLALEAVMMSPHFLFRVEIDPTPNDPTPHRLSDYELASRLSYFLWSSMPDDELFDVADAGGLNEPAAISAQVERMLADPKADAIVDNFAAQWLFLRGLDEHEPDYAVFPAFDDELRQAMRHETELLFRALLDEDLPLDQLLTANFTFVNSLLAQHYGLDVEIGEGFERVQLTGGGRAGLLTQGAILTVTSYPARTSPVKRGKWVLEQLLCSEPPPPPPGVEGLPEGDVTGGTVREQMEQHRTDPVCASCHVEMDSIGFALEHFDAVGAYREAYVDAAIDATGELGNASFDGAQELAAVLTADPRFTNCIVEKMYTYALGRGAEAHDEHFIASIEDVTEGAGMTLRSLITAIATSRPFRYRRGELAAGGI